MSHQYVFVAVVVGVVVLLAARIWRYTARTSGLQAWCASRGWTVQERLRYLPEWCLLLPRGDSRRVHLLASGELRGYPVTIADYSYTRHRTDAEGRRTSSTHRLAVYVVTLPSRWPMVSVRRASLLRKAAQAVGLGRDVEVGDAAFDKEFLVETQDAAAARALLTPAMIAALRADQVPVWSVYDRCLVSYWPGTLDAGLLDQRLDQMVSAADLLPRSTPA